jgi:hypothetical protein
VVNSAIGVEANLVGLQHLRHPQIGNSSNR